MHTLTLTTEELRVLYRILGHHVSGTQTVGLYDKVYQLAKSAEPSVFAFNSGPYAIPFHSKKHWTGRSLIDTN